MTHKNLIPLFIFTCLWFNYTASGQKQAGKDEEDCSLIIEPLDSLTNLYFYQKISHSDHNMSREDTSQVKAISFSDSIYLNKLNRINSMVPLHYNQHVRRFIELYVLRRGEQVERMLGLKHLYFPIFEETLDKYGLPLELKYMAIIESALNPHAVSRSGATGLWQFMYATGRMYGLKVNSYLDERRDPYKSTDAAARFLKDLFAMYKDWTLVIAAYNCGPGNVNKAIRRSGGKTDFWQIRKYLPRETRGYVPAFIAATYVMHYYQDHGFTPIFPAIEFNMIDTIWITKRTDFQMISQFIDLPVEEISFLNPAIKKQIIPAFREPYPLKLPITKIALFEEYSDSIYYSSVMQTEKPANISTSKQSSGTYRQPPSNDQVKIIYTVKSGDNLGYIAEWYDCRTQDIRSDNNLSGNMIKVGQKLIIYVDRGAYHLYSDIDQNEFYTKERTWQ